MGELTMEAKQCLPRVSSQIDISAPAATTQHNTPVVTGKGITMDQNDTPALDDTTDPDGRDLTYGELSQGF